MSKLRSCIQWLAGTALGRAGVVCLNYHRIGDGRASVYDRGLWSADVEAFDAQLRWIKTHFDLVSPSDLAKVAMTGRGRYALVTFDDGYADNFAAAYPLLRTHRAPATFFVATGYIDEPRLPWWDEIAWMVRTSPQTCISLPGYLRAPIDCDDPHRENAVRSLLRAYKTMPTGETAGFLDAIGVATGTGRHGGGCGEALWMTWDMLREMHAGGMTIGGHTVRHQILSRMSHGEQQNEIAGCARRIEEEIGTRMRTFSYPVGHRDSFDARTRACLRDAGVETAFTYYGGFLSFSRWDPYEIPRIAVEQDTSFFEFRALAVGPWLTEPLFGR